MLTNRLSIRTAAVLGVALMGWSPAVADEVSIDALTSIPIIRDAAPPQPEPALDLGSNPAQLLENCSWVWYPEGNPAANAAPGKCYFRITFETLALTAPSGKQTAARPGRSPR